MKEVSNNLAKIESSLADIAMKSKPLSSSLSSKTTTATTQSSSNKHNHKEGSNTSTTSPINRKRKAESDQHKNENHNEKKHLTTAKHEESTSSLGTNNALIIKTGRPRNTRELEAERKKLRRELDKLVKAHGKAAKAVDDFLNEKGNNDSTPIDDDLLYHNNNNSYNIHDNANETIMSKHDLLQQSLFKAFQQDDGNTFAFHGLPSSCTQDALMTWDFLCTFSRTLSLEPIDLDNFIAALNYKPPIQEQDTSTSLNKEIDQPTHDHDHDSEEEFNGNKTENDPLSIAARSAPPIYLAEAHLALLKLLLKDSSSDQWWWSILETPELEALETETTGRGEADNIAPTIKVDILALLDYPEEEIDVTKRWLQALEDVRERRTNSGGAIKSAVKSAMTITKNPFVKAYLRKSLRHWQGNAASFTKQSVMWLIGRVREARPELWGRHIDPETVKEQKAKVVSEAVTAMAQLEDSPDLDTNDDNLQDGDSDEDDSDSDEEDNVNLYEDTKENFAPSKISTKVTASDEKDVNDEMALVTSPVPLSPPPTLVDLMLPPSKPIYNSHILSPFTWSFLSGAAVCRILHRFKRLRNEVDDSLREFRELTPLTKKERKCREKRTPLRVFSECVALLNVTDKTEPSKTIQDVAHFLCNGGDYLQLSPLERLSVLRILIEAAYDTVHVYQCVEDNINARRNATTQLEKEERNARKEAKQAATTLEQDARQRLAQDAINEFLIKKRRELARTNKQTNEFTKDLIESLTVEEILEMDEDNKVEYDALPGPQHFSKAEVRTMIAKINDERAFNTKTLEVITVDDLEVKDGCELSLSRREAIEVLKEAIEDGTIKALRSAIRLAKNEMLCGEDYDTDGMWSLDLLRDAALELKQAEKRKRVTEAQKDLVAKLNKCFVRTEEIGWDRVYNTFWKFGQDVDGRIWIEADVRHTGATNDISSEEPQLNVDSKYEIVGTNDEEGDFSPGRDENFLHFSRQEYHSSGRISSLTRRYCGSVASSHELRTILKYLDGKSIREGALKSSLKQIVESSGFSASDSINNDPEEMNIDEKDQNEGNDIQQKEYVPLEVYRNKLGRFCGRAADAPFSSSALFLSRLMLKREQELYAPLKSRTYDNNWGGKSGARNAWIASMKQYGNDMTAVRDGLLTLEEAFFEMCGGFHDEKEDRDSEVVASESSNLSAKELLENSNTRFDIELESSVQKINGLWNCKQSRLVFREIISCELLLKLVVWLSFLSYLYL